MVVPAGIPIPVKIVPVVKLGLDARVSSYDPTWPEAAITVGVLTTVLPACHTVSA